MAATALTLIGLQSMTEQVFRSPMTLKTIAVFPERSTTCEAVLDLIRDEGCTGDADCGATGLSDGLCRTVGGSANKCTYACSLAAQCPDGVACNTYCGGT